MFAPNWVFDIAIMRTAYEFLSSEVGIEAFGKKYSEGLRPILGRSECARRRKSPGNFLLRK